MLYVREKIKAIICIQLDHSNTWTKLIPLKKKDIQNIPVNHKDFFRINIPTIALQLFTYLKKYFLNFLNTILLFYKHDLFSKCFSGSNFALVQKFGLLYNCSRLLRNEDFVTFQKEMLLKIGRSTINGQMCCIGSSNTYFTYTRP